MNTVSRLTLTLLLGAMSAFATAGPITPEFSVFGPLPQATYGGSGIPNDASAITFREGFLLGLTAHQRFSGPNLENDEQGTFFANPGTTTSPSGLNGSTWNIGYYIQVDQDSIEDSGLTFKLLYDFDAGTDTDEAQLGVLNLSAIFPFGAGGSAAATKQDSQNLLFGYLATPSFFVAPPPGAFNPNANGQYSFALVAYNGQGDELGRSAINVQVGAQSADVPEPGVFALLGLGAAGLAAARRRKQQA
ncbi:PEP-CTERM sorting domain-containing protein [Massilia sp. IC2-477]|uniref:PEP-CTERM sorting domain-containing protein n=1 Tax=Massilia sp. IC2-477 TaxID=2887198 RepID=UPI001D115664|nr:PEP-CTERM sorting domain-containing protein [Massilia sp. IC2-477]MCC2958016.1 PEP-CTERM sorting domain-containing protein [Massilia sp. IC2-477]